MLPFGPHLPIRFRLVAVASVLLLLLAYARAVQAESAYVRVNQAGYEARGTSFRAYLMSTAEEVGASFQVLNSQDVTAYSGHVGPRIGTWSHSRTYPPMTCTRWTSRFQEAIFTRFQCPVLWMRFRPVLQLIVRTRFIPACC